MKSDKVTMGVIRVQWCIPRFSIACCFPTYSAHYERENMHN